MLVRKYLLGFISLPILCLFVMGVLKYPGDLTYYIVFSIVSNTLLYFGFRKNAIFFDAFIGAIYAPSPNGRKSHQAA